MDITEAHKRFLSAKLTGEDSEAVLEAAVVAAREWGYAPDDGEPSDAALSAAENAVVEIIEVITAGLADGSITPSAPVGADTADDDDPDFDILDKLGA